jgi:aerobic C4-dicarboxylate transport protein
MVQPEATAGRIDEAGTRSGPLFGKLYVQVLIAIAGGILLGAYYPAVGVAVKPLGDAFISLIRAVVPVIVFATVAVGIAKMRSIRRVGVVGLKAMIYFEVVSTLALIIGLAVGNALEPGAGLHIDLASLDTKSVGDFVAGAKSMTLLDFLTKMVPTNLIGDIAKGEIMPVLIMATLFGLALCRMGDAGRRVTELLDEAAQAVFGVVRIIMYLAPLAAFAGMAFTVGKFGFATLASLGQLIAAVYVTSILFMLVGLGLIARLFGLRVWKLIRYFKDELLIAFSATSSDAMIPRSMAKLEAMGCSKEVTGLVLPAGFSFNTDGTAIYMSLAVLFIAQATDIPLSLSQQLAILVVMLFTAKGAAGYTGAGFVALAATLPASGVLPAAGLVLLLGIDRFMAEIRAVTNLFSNIVATVVVAKWMGELDEERARSVSGATKRGLGGWPAAAIGIAAVVVVAGIAWPRHGADTGAPQQKSGPASTSSPVALEAVPTPPQPRAAETSAGPGSRASAAPEQAAPPPPAADASATRSPPGAADTPTTPVRSPENADTPTTTPPAKVAVEPPAQPPKAAERSASPVPAAPAQVAARAERAPSKGETDPGTPAGQAAPGLVALMVGGGDGTWVHMARDLADVIDDNARRPLVISGGVEDITDVELLSGADVAIAQADVLKQARQKNGTPSTETFTYIAALNSEELHFLARREIAKIDDLAGQKVAFAGGAVLTGRVVLDLLQVKVKSVVSDPETALADLKAGRIAALAYVAAKPVPLFRGLTPGAGAGLHFLPIPPPSPGLDTGYMPRQLTSSDYPDLIGSDGPIPTIGVAMVMIAPNLAPKSERYRRVAGFVDAFFSALPDLQQPPHHRIWKTVDLATKLPGWTRFPEAEAQLEH